MKRAVVGRGLRVVAILAGCALGACQNEAPAGGTGSASAPSGKQASGKSAEPAKSAAPEVSTVPALIVKLGGSPEEQKAATEQILAIGAPAVAPLREWMLKADKEASMAPKNKQWDIVRPMQGVLFACKRIGEACVPALQDLAAQTKDKPTKDMVCLILDQNFKKPCP
jgi:hypothetical protein